MKLRKGYGVSFGRGAASVGPANTVAPVASGVGIVSQTLSVTTGTWTGNPAPTFTYQWQRGGVDIALATNNTYLLVAADAGQSIRAVVTATNGVGAPVSANSNAIAVFASFMDVGALTSGQMGFARATQMLLRGAHYGSPIVRLRRTGDSAESDFGVGTDGLLDSGVIAWVVAGGGTQGALVVTIYDQSGQGRNQTNATPTEQAAMVVSGAFSPTFGTNTKPALNFDGTNDNYTGNADVLISSGTPFTIFIGGRPTGGVLSYKTILSIKKSGTNVSFFYSNDPIYSTFSVCSGSGIANLRSPGAPYNANYLINYAYNGAGSLTTASNFSARVNNVSQTLTASGPVGAVTMNNFYGKAGDGSVMQGLGVVEIMVLADVTANYNTLNGNLNTFFGIY